MLSMTQILSSLILLFRSFFPLSPSDLLIHLFIDFGSTHAKRKPEMNLCTWETRLSRDVSGLFLFPALVYKHAILLGLWYVSERLLEAGATQARGSTGSKNMSSSWILNLLRSIVAAQLGGQHTEVAGKAELFYRAHSQNGRAGKQKGGAGFSFAVFVIKSISSLCERLISKLRFH